MVYLVFHLAIWHHLSVQPPFLARVTVFELTLIRKILQSISWIWASKSNTKSNDHDDDTSLLTTTTTMTTTMTMMMMIINVVNKSDESYNNEIQMILIETNDNDNCGDNDNDGNSNDNGDDNDNGETHDNDDNNDKNDGDHGFLVETLLCCKASRKPRSGVGANLFLVLLPCWVSALSPSQWKQWSRSQHVQLAISKHGGYAVYIIDGWFPSSIHYL